jgi:Sugar phosphate isomerases/epimerases
MTAFSTMLLLNLKPLEAVKVLALEGLHIELGYDNFAVFGGKHAEDAMLKELEELGEDVKSFIKTAHMPYDDVDADLIPLEAIEKRMVKWLDTVARLGASIAVFHTVKTLLRDPLEVNIEFFRTITREAVDRGITVAVENRLEKDLFGSSPGDLKALAETIGEGIGVCLDVGHANITKNLQQFLSTLGDVVVELHLHDNDGSRDLHKPPQTGTVNWGLIMQWLKSRSRVVPVFEIACTKGVKNCIAIAKSVSKWFTQ